jgi:tRNA dimethylallyltransferase
MAFLPPLPKLDPVVLIVGPTASGKSALAMAYATHLQSQAIRCELISMDSAQVYRNMDIGTAKPSAQDREQVPHHLIDVREPHEAFSAAQFEQSTKRLVQEIRARGARPVIVGGTMLYARALLHGLHDIPGADLAVRKAIEQEAAAIGWPAMHARLLQLDPVTAQRLQPQDAQRISRALEVFQATGRALSAWIEQAPALQGPGFEWKMVALEPSDRAVLHERIAQRFQAMLATGLLDELRQLRLDPRLHANLPAMRCVGYRQAWEHLDGLIDFDTLQAQGIAATRQLAKRQLTWLRAMPERIVLDANDSTFQNLQRLLQIERNSWSMS